MERDDEWNIQGKLYDFGARIYDSRVGRFLSLNPLKDINQTWSHYSFGVDYPILSIDDNGDPKLNGLWQSQDYKDEVAKDKLENED